MSTTNRVRRIINNEYANSSQPFFNSPLGNVYCKECDNEMMLWFNRATRNYEYICLNDETYYILDSA